MLFLITNQSNCFTLFVLKLGGDTINNIEDLAEDQSQTLDKLPNNIDSFNADALMKATQLYGNGKTKRKLKSIVRKVFQHA